MPAQLEKQVLVLEDEAIIGLDLAEGLANAGFRPLGPFSTVADALEMIESTRPHAAVLDIDLGGGQTSLPVAERLIELGVPFLFLTGQSVRTTAVLDNFPAHTCLDKPVMPDELMASVSAMFAVEEEEA